MPSVLLRTLTHVCGHAAAPSALALHLAPVPPPTQTDKRLSEQWCQKITEAAMQEYKQARHSPLISNMRALHSGAQLRSFLPVTACVQAA